jgi:pimeloyl-ACP methyl ester carboxylesterase
MNPDPDPNPGDVAGVHPFEVRVPDEVLDDLRRRLAATRLPDAVAGAGWDEGTDLDYLRKLLADWHDRFDWRAQERAINALDHYRTEVDGLSVHFVHQRGGGPEPLPLLMLHGWPGSFLQMAKILPLLTEPGDASFHVVVPSLPGFGFSDRPAAPGVGAAGVAARLHQVMERLGYPRYLVRASDLGAGVALQLAARRPGAVVGLHLTGVSPDIDLDHLPPDLTPAEQHMVAGIRAFRADEAGYARVQETRPQSLAVGLNDSPAGLAAWVVEKYRAWSDCDGDVEARFTRNELLTQLTVYWATQTIGSSMRHYYENRRRPPAPGAVRAPIAVAAAPGDVYPTPREWFERRGPLAQFTDLPRGGHFLEHEEPELLAVDLRAFRRLLAEFEGELVGDAQVLVDGSPGQVIGVGG